MKREAAEIIVATALRDRARELVAIASETEVVEVATREWKKYSRRLAELGNGDNGESKAPPSETSEVQLSAA